MGWTQTGTLSDATNRSAHPFAPLRPPVASVPLPDNAVTRVLLAEGATQINDLARLSDLSVREVMAVLFDLEMDGLVTTLPGGVYKLVK